jgi:hypothetical protein
MKQRSSIKNIIRLIKAFSSSFKKFESKTTQRSYDSKFSKTKNVWFSRKKFV